MSTLAKTYGVAKSSIERDMDTLKAAGFPVETVADPKHAQRIRWQITDPEFADAMLKLRKLYVVGE